MIVVHPTDDVALIEAIINNKELMALTDGQGETVGRINPAFSYLLITTDNNPVGLFSIRKCTNLVVEAHIRILPWWWKTLSLEAAIAGILWMRDNTTYTKIMTTIPGNCHHVKKFSLKVGFKKYGQIEDGIIYNNELVPLEYHELNITR